MKKIALWFKRAFSNVAKYFTEVFGKAKEFLKKEIPVAVSVVDVLKELVESPFTPLVTGLIPGVVDDVIVVKAKEILPTILVQLKIAKDCADLKTNDAIIRCAIQHLQSLDKNARRGKYLEIAASLSEYLTDGKLSWEEIIHLVQRVKTASK